MNEDYTVEIQKAPPETFFERIKTFGLALWTLPKRIYNTYLLIRYQEFREPAAKNVCPMRYLNPFKYLNLNAKIATQSSVMKAVLKYARKDDKGLFWDKDNADALLPIVRDLYPDETITEEDLVFTCSQENLRKFRQPLLQFIGPNNIDKRAAEMESIIEKALDFYVQGEKERTINATKFSLALPVAMISRLLLSHPGPMIVYQEIANSIDWINRCVMKRMLKQPLSKEEQKEYLNSIENLRSAIDISYQSEEEDSFSRLLKEQMTPVQVRAFLYSSYFAGSDTTGGVLNYLLWQLGQHPEIQEKIFEELLASKKNLFCFAKESLAIDQLISESLRLFSPAYTIGRIAKDPLKLIVKDKKGNIVHQEKIRKNEKILSFPTFAGRDPLMFDQPDTFNPHRFPSQMKSYSWFPFGDGAHSCPGQWLSKTEISLFVAKLVQRYQIHSSPEKEFRQLGYITLKASEEVQLKLILR